MNHDRLRTRVWDKQEKRMLYPMDLSFDETYERQIEPFNKLNGDLVIGFTNKGILCQMDYEGSLLLPFGDRFVPMQCWGLPDKNKKLIYDDDIIKLEGDLYLCSFNGFSFGLSSIKEVPNILVPTPLTRNRSEIIGNRWENEKLMAVKA